MVVALVVWGLDKTQLKVKALVSWQSRREMGKLDSTAGNNHREL